MRKEVMYHLCKIPDFFATIIGYLKPLIFQLLFVMSVISLVLLLLQLIYAAPSFSCDWYGYDDYLKYYQSKCWTACEEYKKYRTVF